MLVYAVLKVCTFWYVLPLVDNCINQGKSIMKLLELSEIQHMDIEGCIDLFC